MTNFLQNNKTWGKRRCLLFASVGVVFFPNFLQMAFAQDLPLGIFECADCHIWSVYSTGAVSVASLFFGALVVLYLRRPVNLDPKPEQASSLAALFFDSSDEAMVVTDAGGKIQSVNPAFTLVTGYSAKDVLGQHVSFLASLRHDQAFYDRIQAELNSSGYWKGEVWIRHNSGQDCLQWVRLNVMPHSKDNASCYMALFYDVTEYKQAEIEVQQLASRLNLVLETVGEGILGLDEKERITFANPAAARFLGFESAQSLLGRNCTFVTHHLLSNGSACNPSTCAIRSTLNTGKMNRVSDEFFCNQDGVVFPVDYVVSPLSVDQKIVGAVIAFHDISSIKESERELKRSNAELEQFAFVASNDLRQPLRMIVTDLGEIENRIQSHLDDETKAFFESSKSGAIKMDQMIANLLDYARVGRGAAKFRPVYLPPIVADALRHFQLDIESVHAKIEIAEYLPTILGDASELLRLFHDLIGNALKCRLADVAPVVEIGCKADNNQWVIWVKDNGIGIETKDIDQAFGLFQRQDVVKSFDGTGIGLAVCKKIVDRHGGRIWIESEFGAGSTFYISFPVLPPQI